LTGENTAGVGAAAPLVQRRSPGGEVEMKFQILSHAGLMVTAAGVDLLCDPWLVGSAYWRSWWNYPPVPATLVDGLKPDFIALTHLHWDHFHGPTLRRFDPATPVIVPYDRYDRMVRDLKSVGMTNVIELRHGEQFQLAPGFSLTSYHFSPFVTDSALVIEGEGTTLLNANDAKLVGGPLNQILRAHPPIDFAFRSHSSANARANYHVTDSPDDAVDDTEHYLQSFSLFMARIKPRVAIPFANNNCLLHDDNFAMIDLIQTPLMLADYFARFAAEHDLATTLQIMVPGDSWSAGVGFDCPPHDWFTDRAKHLAAYRERVQPTLARQAAIEARVTVSLSAVEKFFATLVADLPVALRRRAGGDVLLVALSSKRTDGFAVDLAAGTVRTVAPDDFHDFDARIEFPAIILLQSLRMNMFGHGSISKRVNYFATVAAMPRLKRFVQALDISESELIPVQGNFSRRSLRAAVPRWREAVLYSQVAIELARGRSFTQIETKMLSA
jgi:UDP-MurNAc hydroxylase